MLKEQKNAQNDKKDKIRMKIKEIFIKDHFITVGQLLKLTNLFSSGGEVKNCITLEGVYVNHEIDYRRGRKLYENDIISLKTGETFIVKKSSSI